MDARGALAVPAGRDDGVRALRVGEVEQADGLVDARLAAAAGGEVAPDVGRVLDALDRDVGEPVVSAEISRDAGSGGGALLRSETSMSVTGRTMLPCSVVARAKMNVIFLHGPLTRSFMVRCE